MAAGLRLARTACYAELYAFYRHHLPARLFRGNWRSSQPLRLFASRNSPASRSDVLAWIKARFAGSPAPGNCPP